MQIILASGSPYRQKLLASTGLTFTVQMANIDEQSIHARLPKSMAAKRALAKAMWVSERQPKNLVIGCDQVLEFEKKSFAKVAHRLAAFERLKKMAGKSHWLHSAFCIVKGKRVLHAEVVSAKMQMRSLRPQEIRRYLMQNEWQDSVGCYQFENWGVHLFRDVQGDSSTIIGLPLCALLAALRKLGINPLAGR